MQKHAIYIEDNALCMLTSMCSPLSQVRSHTVVHGTTATGVLPDRMSSPDTTGNTPEPSPSSASPAAAASHAPTTWLCTWSVTRTNTDMLTHTNTHIITHTNRAVSLHPKKEQNKYRTNFIPLRLRANKHWVIEGIQLRVCVPHASFKLGVHLFFESWLRWCEMSLSALIQQFV